MFEPYLGDYSRIKIPTKKCTKCGERKPITSFSKKEEVHSCKTCNDSGKRTAYAKREYFIRPKAKELSDKLADKELNQELKEVWEDG